MLADSVLVSNSNDKYIEYKLAYKDVTLFITIIIYDTSRPRVKALIRSVPRVISYFPKYKNNLSDPLILKNFAYIEVANYYLFRIYPTLLYTIYPKDSMPYIFPIFTIACRFCYCKR